MKIIISVDPVEKQSGTHLFRLRTGFGHPEVRFSRERVRFVCSPSAARPARRSASWRKMKRAIEVALTTSGMIRGRDILVSALALAQKESKVKK